MDITDYENRIELHGHGHVWLERTSGTELDIANSARVSLDKCVDEMDERSERLVRRLYKMKHGTPFEDIFFKFDIKASISVVREFQRHRVPWSYSEKSLRYVEADGEFYIPAASHVRRQIGGSMGYEYEPIENQATVIEAQDIMADAYDHAMLAYRSLLDLDVAKELARNVLPVGIFTHMKARTNLRGLLSFLALRNEEHALQEIQDIAQAMEDLAKQVAPITFEEFVKAGRVAV